MYRKYPPLKGKYMKDIPDAILSRFMGRLERSQVPASYYAEYLQWLRYYLDFSTRSRMPDSKAARVRLYCDKLKSTNRTDGQLRRAAHAVSLYFEIVKIVLPPELAATSGGVVDPAATRTSGGGQAPFNVPIVEEATFFFKGCNTGLV